MPGGKSWCKAPGCTNQSQGGGRCRRHGAVRKRCSAPGCDNLAIKNGVCRSHGERCKVDGCSNQSQQGGVCYRHGAKRRPRICKVEGCSKNAKKIGLCYAHGGRWDRAQKLCSVNGCPNISLVKGLCTRHGAPRKKCGAPGCTKNAVQGGLCKPHGAKPSVNKKCSATGCMNYAQKGGVCKRHGAKVAGNNKCSVADCTRKAIVGGVCRRHGNLICRAKGCNYQAISVRVMLCPRHRIGKNDETRRHGSVGAEKKRKRDVPRKEPSVPDPELGAALATRRKRARKTGQKSEPETHAPTAGGRRRRQELPAEEVERTPKRRGKRRRSKDDSDSDYEAEDWTARKRTHPAAGRTAPRLRGRSPIEGTFGTSPLRRSARTREDAAATKRDDEGMSKEPGSDDEGSRDEFDGTTCNDEAPPAIASIGGNAELELASDRFLTAPSSGATVPPGSSLSIILSKGSRGNVSCRVSSRAYDSEEEEELGAQIYQSSLTARSIKEK